jgi:DNA-directed RNA polymerase subunit RPC12/RpoP
MKEPIRDKEGYILCPDCKEERLTKEEIAKHYHCHRCTATLEFGAE